ncbi:cation-translocating P-type ATPase [Vibrio sp. JC009]|uniref:heavy metal translocating P-type ATPase n=1 Tax=Vibrio sp. JC009 TaxID=2912314 RepID=UPI0023AEEBD7|nr:cation-translocating P-type ATPase [Vibrio sp. JC009]WED24667.1 cation-translocating P-type ATPase [Vibrio sp. JC009]
MSNFVIKHEIPGRLRLGIDAIKDLSFRNGLQSDFENTSGVIQVKINPICSSLLLRYDPETVSRQLLLEKLQRLLPVSASSACCETSECGCKADEPPATKTELKRFAGITALTAGSFIRTSIMGATVSQALFSPLGLMTLGFSIPIIWRGLKSLKERRPNMDSFLAGGIAASLIGGEAMTALEILWINSGADTLSAWIHERSRKHISDILDITSHHTFVLENGIEIEREVSQVQPGDIVVLHTGEKISVDGVIIHGQAMLNEAPITGHQELKHKQESDQVFAGTFVQEGVIQVRVEHVGDTTYLARVMCKVENALENRAPIEGVADRLAEKVLKLGVGSTLITYLLTGSIMRAYTVLLVMACPCATVLAASTAVSAAMNSAARSQILIKGGRYLEEVGKCETVFFDKTGTLTTSCPSLAETATAKGVTEKELLQLAASAETHNHHPLAQAVMEEAKLHGTFPIPHQECDYHLGMGMRALLEEGEILVGNAKLAQHYGISMDSLNGLEQTSNEFKARGLTVLYVYKDKVLQGMLGFEALERPETKETIRKLRELGVKRVVLVTGDEEPTARAIAERLGMDDYHASMMPEDKGRVIDAETSQYGPVIMIGDGINDALALTQAEVGVAFGTAGSEVAVEAADIALVKDDLTGLVSVYSLSQKTIRVANQNFWIATGSNIVGVVLGAIGWLSPVTAGLVHVGHSLGVVANSTRLLRLPDSEREQ